MPNKYAIALTIEIHDLMFSHYYFEKFGLPVVSKSFGSRMRFIDLHCFFTAFVSCSIDPCVGHLNRPNYSFAEFYNVYGTIFVYELLRSLLHQSSHFSQNAISCYEL